MVILAGGLATRLGPLTAQLPKSLVEVAGLPFAVHQIQLLRRNNITDITFLTGHLGYMLWNTLGDGSRWGVSLRYVPDGQTRLGTAGAVRHALPLLRNPFFLMYGDSYLPCDYTMVARKFLRCQTQGLMTVYRNDVPWLKSNVQFEDERIVRYNKQDPNDRMQHIDYGLSVFTHEAFREETSDLSEVYHNLLQREQLSGCEVGFSMCEIGSHEGLQATKDYFAERNIV